jgi:hypothetical protein
MVPDVIWVVARGGGFSGVCSFTPRLWLNARASRMARYIACLSATGLGVEVVMPTAPHKDPRGIGFYARPVGKPEESVKACQVEDGHIYGYVAHKLKETFSHATACLYSSTCTRWKEDVRNDIICDDTPPHAGFCLDENSPKEASPTLENHCHVCRVHRMQLCCRPPRFGLHNMRKPI